MPTFNNTNNEEEQVTLEADQTVERLVPDEDIYGGDPFLLEAVASHNPNVRISPPSSATSSNNNFFFAGGYSLALNNAKQTGSPVLVILISNTNEDEEYAELFRQNAEKFNKKIGIVVLLRKGTQQYDVFTEFHHVRFLPSVFVFTPSGGVFCTLQKPTIETFVKAIALLGSQEGAARSAEEIAEEKLKKLREIKERMGARIGRSPSSPTTTAVSPIPEVTQPKVEPKAPKPAKQKKPAPEKSTTPVATEPTSPAAALSDPKVRELYNQLKMQKLREQKNSSTTTTPSSVPSAQTPTSSSSSNTSSKQAIEKVFQNETKKNLEKASTPTTQYVDTRVAIRTPSGEVVRNTFLLSDTLDKVLQSVKEHVQNISMYNLVNAYGDRKVFSIDDPSMTSATLKELGFLNSMTLILSPKEMAQQPAYSGEQSGPGIVARVITFVYSILLLLWTSISSLFSKKATSTHAPPASEVSPSSPSTPTSSSSSNTKPASKRVGGFMTLSDLSRDNDKDNKNKNNWNGNSTQYQDK